MKTYKIHLIRHGLTEGNYLGQYIGCRTDLPLSAAGVDELRMLKETTDYPDIDILYSSPMLRCRQTAAVLYPGYDVNTVDNLMEYDFGEFEGKTAAQLETVPEFINWASGKEAAPPKGERNEDFIKRICLGFNQIVRDMMEKGVTSAGVIMHGGAIMMLLSATAVPRKQTVEWTSDAGKGYSVMVTPSLITAAELLRFMILFRSD